MQPFAWVSVLVGPAACRSTPAGAGQPGATSSAGAMPWEHPRVHGATIAGVTLGRADYGASPRLRGRHVPERSSPSPHRNIPASAGSPKRESLDSVLRREHPRVCGVAERDNRESHRGCGTSPRLRGRPTGVGTPSPWYGNIPASAGSPPTLRCRNPGTPEHPRVCGVASTDFDIWAPPISPPAIHRGFLSGPRS